MKRLTKHTRAVVGARLEIKWGTSRGRDTYGYTTCALYEDGRKVSACNGGGYDMRGTVVGGWLEARLAPALVRLKAAEMPERSHWEPERARVCAGKCREDAREFAIRLRVGGSDAEVMFPKLAEDCWECPVCGGATSQSRDGKRVDDGRALYGLTFHNPNFNPGKAVIGKGCSDRTFGGSEGETVEQSEKAGKSLGLERYQAFYSASSPVPTRRHRVPLVDGACGLSSVEAILRAVGLALRRLDSSRSRSGPALYEVVSAM